MRVFVTGAGGFVGSHVAEHFARQGHKVVAIDSHDRAARLENAALSRAVTYRNWRRIASLPNVRTIRMDVRNAAKVMKIVGNSDIVIHAAAQVAPSVSLSDPWSDFQTNVVGTVNLLESLRRSRGDPTFILCSTNKVYGEGVNALALHETSSRYVLKDPHYRRGIPEDFPIDHTRHSPYGVSKLSADLYAQEYGHSYGLRTGVFRMSCIYGPGQLGSEEQGWISHFVLSAVEHRQVKVFGNGKQLRDVLHVGDLVRAFVAYSLHSRRLGSQVFNIGGGPDRTLSPLELLRELAFHLGRPPRVAHMGWRTADQRVYVSDISRVSSLLHWQPSVFPIEGIEELVRWAASGG